ncbi:glucose-6-phosphate dehydrogenase [Caulobacter sp. S45]|uniref:glucose-6-phosphate dehydrogenase n=1 Tax=Caulobacter sp. S45 TaxID=1641861 RepID=UPI00131A69B5|nr:glucose-6-phosphate dehydrogenase [Caulobacter sp. S45]
MLHPVPASTRAKSRHASEGLVIFGGTGDLALRMLFPSLYFLEDEGLLPPDLRIIGTARSDLEDAAFAAQVKSAVQTRAGDDFSDETWARFAPRLRYAAVDVQDAAAFSRLGEVLEARRAIFYLSTSPALFGAVCQNLQVAGLVRDDSRVVVEKPIGRDLKSCQAINDTLASIFTEDRIFRVDHYLGKEAVQNLLALRFANTLFEPLWNKASIDHVQITVAETVGVEGRWSYYDDYGALRDMVQNHLLQLLSLVAMEPPASLDPDSVRNEKIKVLQSLRPITGRDVERNTARGQYIAGVADGRSAPGYADESGGDSSETETFVALLAHVDNWRWAGTPFYLRTGKRLPARSSEIVIQFREVPHSIFGGVDLMANRLTIRLQPEEEISLALMNKTPSLEHNGMTLKPLSLNLSLSHAFKDERPRRIAYERLLLEVLHDNQTLFVRRDEQETAWRWIDAIRHGWDHKSTKPSPYPAGTWGPSSAFALIERHAHSWCE